MIPCSSNDPNKDSSSSDSEVDVDLEVAASIREWVKKCNPLRSHVTELLTSLKKFHKLPADYRTLMNTPRNIVFKDVDPGQYYHFGIVSGLAYLIKPGSDVSNFTIQLHIDGASLFKSSTFATWPILCKVRPYEETF